MAQRRWNLELTAECWDLLGEARASRCQEVADDPRALLAVLRRDADLGLALIQCDTLAGLGRWFSPDGAGWAGDAGLSGALGEGSFAAAWTFDGRHDQGGRPGGGPLGGVLPTGRDVKIRGFTILGVEVDDEDGVEKLMVRRYVDWAGVFGQLGLTLNWRVPLPADA